MDPSITIDKMHVHAPLCLIAATGTAWTFGIFEVTLKPTDTLYSHFRTHVHTHSWNMISIYFNTEKVWLLEWVNHVPKLSKIVARKIQSCQNLGKWPRPCPYLGKIVSRESNNLESSFSHQHVRNRPICNSWKGILSMMYQYTSPRLFVRAYSLARYNYWDIVYPQGKSRRGSRVSQEISWDATGWTLAHSSGVQRLVGARKGFCDDKQGDGCNDSGSGTVKIKEEELEDDVYFTHTSRNGSCVFDFCPI